MSKIKSQLVIEDSKYKEILHEIEAFQPSGQPDCLELFGLVINDEFNVWGREN